MLLAATNGYAKSATDVAGRWASEGSIIEITAQDEQLSARVIALMEPTYGEGEAGPTGATRLDDNNPDPQLKKNPVMGLELLIDYTFDGERWSGKIYDPESGNTYSSRMRVDRQGNLKMRGYIGVPLLGRTALFEPISKCTEPMRIMLERSGHQESCIAES